MKFSAFCNKVPNMAHTRRMLNEQILMSLKCFWSARFPKGNMMIKKNHELRNFAMLRLFGAIGILQSIRDSLLRD